MLLLETGSLKETMFLWGPSRLEPYQEKYKYRTYDNSEISDILIINLIL